jgi:hypothetical protein
MVTKRFWAPLPDRSEDRRSERRLPANFYGVELSEGGRYLRRITNVSEDGLLLENPLGDERPGQVIELELPRLSSEHPITRTKVEVVYVTPDGHVGVRRLLETSPLEAERLGGPIAL